jgi:actin-related protein 8
MIISTQHLLLVKESQPPTVAPAIADSAVPPANPTEGDPTSPPKDATDATGSGTAETETDAVKQTPSDGDIEMQDVDAATKQDQASTAGAELPASSDPPASLKTSRPPSPTTALNGYDPTYSYPGGYPLDIEFEASKLPLDVAVFNSTRACGGGDEKIRKYLQAVLVVGGTSLIPGMAHALESR